MLYFVINAERLYASGRKNPSSNNDDDFYMKDDGFFEQQS